MNSVDSFSLKGHLRIIKREGESREVVYSGDNIIVNGGKLLALQQLFYYGSGNPLYTGKVGSGGATDVGGLFLRTPTADRTNLYTPEATVGLTKASENTAVPSITLVATVDASQCNGITINEAGFFAKDGTMFNMITFPGIVKTSLFSLDLEWSISFV